MDKKEIVDLAFLASSTAETIAKNGEELEYLGADFATRNISVLLDRLNARQFSDLPKDAQDQIAMVARVGKSIAPLSEGQRQRLENESALDYYYRTSVREPVHNFQQLVGARNFDPNDSSLMVNIRHGISAAGAAFALAILETHAIPDVASSTDYFWGNVVAAAKHAERIRGQSASSE